MHGQKITIMLQCLVGQLPDELDSTSDSEL